MNLTDIKKLVKLVESSEISEIEIEEGEERIRIIKHHPRESSPQMISPMYQPAGVQPQQFPVSQAQETAPSSVPISAKTSNLVEVTSPMVGTFYRAASPEAPSYVEIGDSVKTGQALCIIEAMKLMNEIESEASGKVVEILVENAQPVEFGQVLFKIDPSF